MNLTAELRRRLQVPESVPFTSQGHLVCLEFPNYEAAQQYMNTAEFRHQITMAYMLGIVTLRVQHPEETEDFTPASWIPTEGMARADRRNARYKQLALRRAKARR